MIMVQTRICAHFQGTCNHGSLESVTFLHLPEHLRHRIYNYYTELPSSTLIHLKVLKGVAVFPIDDEVDKLSSFAILRLVSRVVNADVPRCLSLHYRVLICGPEITATFLNVLGENPWNLFEYVRCLTIILNGFKYHLSSYGSSYDHGTTAAWNGFRETCKITDIWTSSDVSSFLPVWKAIIARLTELEHVAELDLNLICDVEDTKAASPILDFLRPPLQIRECKIRLHPQRDPSLQELARQTVFRITGRQTAD